MSRLRTATGLVVTALLFKPSKPLPAQTRTHFADRPPGPPLRPGEPPPLPTALWQFEKEMNGRAVLIPEVREDPILGPQIADRLKAANAGQDGVITQDGLIQFYAKAHGTPAALTQAQFQRLWQLSFGPRVTKEDFVRAARRGVDINALQDLALDRRTFFGDRQSGKLQAADTDHDLVIQGLPAGAAPGTPTEAARLFELAVCYASDPGCESVAVAQPSGRSLTSGGEVYTLVREAAGLPTSLDATLPATDFAGGSAALRIAQLAAREVRRTSLAHRNAADSRAGIGLYAGTESAYAQLSEPERLRWLYRKYSTEPWASPMPDWVRTYDPLPTDPGPIGWTDHAPKFKDCLWVMDVLGAAYAEAGLSERWAQIAAVVKREDDRGTTLMREMQKEGWIGVYWSADVKHPDAKEKWQVKQHNDGRKLAERGDFFGVRIVDAVVNYRLTGGKAGATLDTEKLARVPFALLAARNGTHMAVMVRGGALYEVHRGREPTQRSILSRTDSLLELDWSTGALLIPPESWDTRLTQKDLRKKIEAKPLPRD